MPLAFSTFAGGQCQAVELASNFQARELLVAPKVHDHPADLFLLWMHFELARKRLESEWGIEGTVVFNPSGVAATTPHLDA
ncbi:hypothetical protein J8J17_22020, partial [Mycobacterium tuberculosis]|nr:hypothetical protein [Mycobacterium tuberculosis]